MAKKDKRNTLFIQPCRKLPTWYLTKSSGSPDPTLPIAEIDDNIVLRLEPHMSGSMYSQRYTGGQIPLDPLTGLSQGVGTIYDTGKRGLVLQMTTGTVPTLVSRTGMNAGIAINDAAITMPGTSLYKLFHAVNPIWGFRAKVFFESSSSGSNTNLITTTNAGNSATSGILIRKSTAEKIQIFVSKGVASNYVLAYTSTISVNINSTNTIILNVNEVGVGNAELIVNGVSEVFDVSQAGQDIPQTAQLCIGGLTTGGSGITIGNLEVKDTIYTPEEITSYLSYNPDLVIGANRPVKVWDIDMTLDNLFSDVSGTIPANADESVRYINNNLTLPPNTPKRYLSAPVSGAQLKVDYIGGLNALLFNGGTNNYNFSEQMFPELCGSGCIFIFARNTDSIYGSHPISGERYFAITGEDYSGFYDDPYGAVHAGAFVDGNTASGAPVGTTDEYLIFAIRREGRKVSVYNMDGVKGEKLDFNVSMFFNKMGEAHSTIGSDWNMDGEIVRIVKYNGNLSEAQIISVINTLKAFI